MIPIPSNFARILPKTFGNRPQFRANEKQDEKQDFKQGNSALESSENLPTAREQMLEQQLELMRRQLEQSQAQMALLQNEMAGLRLAVTQTPVLSIKKVGEDSSELHSKLKLLAVKEAGEKRTLAIKAKAEAEKCYAKYKALDDIILSNDKEVKRLQDKVIAQVAKLNALNHQRKSLVDIISKPATLRTPITNPEGQLRNVNSEIDRHKKEIAEYEKRIKKLNEGIDKHREEQTVLWKLWQEHEKEAAQFKDEEAISNEKSKQLSAVIAGNEEASPLKKHQDELNELLMKKSALLKETDAIKAKAKMQIGSLRIEIQKKIKESEGKSANAEHLRDCASEFLLHCGSNSRTASIPWDLALLSKRVAHKKRVFQIWRENDFNYRLHGGKVENDPTGQARKYANSLHISVNDIYKQLEIEIKYWNQRKHNNCDKEVRDKVYQELKKKYDEIMKLKMQDEAELETAKQKYQERFVAYQKLDFRESVQMMKQIGEKSYNASIEEMEKCIKTSKSLDQEVEKLKKEIELLELECKKCEQESRVDDGALKNIDNKIKKCQEIIDRLSDL